MPFFIYPLSPPALSRTSIFIIYLLLPLSLPSSHYYVPFPSSLHPLLLHFHLISYSNYSFLVFLAFPRLTFPVTFSYLHPRPVHFALLPFIINFTLPTPLPPLTPSTRLALVIFCKAGLTGWVRHRRGSQIEHGQNSTVHLLLNAYVSLGGGFGLFRRAGKTGEDGSRKRDGDNERFGMRNDRQETSNV